MSSREIRTHAALVFVAILFAMAVRPGSVLADSSYASAAAQQPAATHAGAPAGATSQPSPSAVPDAPSDPCGGPTGLFATLDRPTIGYSACAVPSGSIVLEEGYQNQSQGGASPAVLTTYPQGFERIGVADRLEVDLIGPAYNRLRTTSTVSSGYDDIGVGAKFELPPRGRFTYAFDGLFQAATGTGGFGAGGPTSVANVDIAYAASSAVGLGTTLATGVSSGTTPSGRVARYGYFLPSFVVTAQIPNAYQFYAELVGQTKLAPGAGGHVFTDFGLQKLLGPNVEVDGEYGRSFTPVGGSRFHDVGLGVGLRVR